MIKKKVIPPSTIKRAPAGKSALRSSHAAALKDVHPELEAMVNNFLQEKKIPLQLHSIRFSTESPGACGCCMIGGMIHCGPECP